MKIKRIGVALKEGCCIDGADLAIQALEKEGKLFDAVVAIREMNEPYPKNLLHLPQIVDITKRIKSEVRKVLDEGNFPLTFGGDHALAIGSIGASSSKDLAVLWVDAHGDCNTDETTITGRIHGMPLAILLGHGNQELLDIVQPNYLDPSNVILFGIRDLDEMEEKSIRDWGVTMYTMKDIQTIGLKQALQEVSQKIGSKKLHLSFDLDSMNPAVIKAVNTPVADGFSIEEATEIISTIFTTCNVQSMDVVEYNPTRDDGTTSSVIEKIDRLVQTKKGE